MIQIFIEIDDNERYEGVGPDAGFLSREYGKSPNGNPFGGWWVLRDHLHQYIDHDQFRTDLAERHKLTLIDHQTVLTSTSN
jgi:hypothetical protein